MAMSGQTVPETEKPAKIVQISHISAKSHGRVAAVYSDHSASNTFHGGIHHHQHTELPEPRPEPQSTVPFPRDPVFVCRDALLQIHDIASTPGSRAVLVGLGGVGKTQIAIEYSHRVRQESPDTWVIWIHASNAARCRESLQDLARRANIPGHQDPNANIFQLVGDWLEDEKSGKWTLILDNVDDDWLLRRPLATRQRNASTRPPLEYIPRNSKGSVIITSRDRGLALRMAQRRNVIDVQQMTKAEALALLQTKLDVPERSEDMRQLVEVLEFMPLAITQAAAYITHRSPRCSVSQYLEKTRKSDREAIRLLSREPGDIHRDWEARNSILLTWQISFDHIQCVRPSAAGLLSLTSFFDRQGIPVSILRVHQYLEHNPEMEDSNSEDDSDSASGSDTDQDLEDDITTLCDYSLTSIGEHNTVLTMHRLVQLTVRKWLKVHGQFEHWKQAFISTLYQEFPLGEYENWAMCRTLYPHVISAMSQRPETLDSQRDWAELLYRGAWYALEMGNASDAEELASKSREQRVAIFGADSEEALNSTVLLAEAYSDQGRWEEAEQLQVRVVETSKNKFGEDHPLTLTSMANLATSYWDQDRWEEAEQLDVRGLEASKAELGEDDRDTLISMANLSCTYWSQGRWEEAEKLDVEVMEIRKEKFGVDHPHTLMSMANLAYTYSNQGRWEEAEQLQTRVMEIRKAKLGEDHPDTLTSMANLASTCWDQDRWDEAEQLQVRVLEKSTLKLGGDHPDTLARMAKLASTYWTLGKWEEAEQLDMQVVETSKAKLGEEHPHTLTRMSNLAFVWKSTGKTAEAIDLLKDCLAKQERAFGSDHHDTILNRETLLEWEAK